MAPRGRRPKVGLGRMDAALDAMRPMGFQADAVRKSVRKLLKVYGDEGWVFIEEAAYKLLIDTMLEEPEGGTETGLPQLEFCSQGSVNELGDKEASNDDHEEPLLPLESCSRGSHEQAALGNELCDKEAISDGHEELLPPLGNCSKGSHERSASVNELCEATCDEQEEPLSAPEIHGSGRYCQDIVELDGEKMEGQDLGFEDVEGHKEIRREVVLAPVYNPQPVNVVPTDGTGRPCYGWISDDDDEGHEMIEATPSTSMLTDGVAA